MRSKTIHTNRLNRHTRFPDSPQPSPAKPPAITLPETTPPVPNLKSKPKQAQATASPQLSLAKPNSNQSPAKASPNQSPVKTPSKAGLSSAENSPVRSPAKSSPQKSPDQPSSVPSPANESPEQYPAMTNTSQSSAPPTTPHVKTRTHLTSTKTCLKKALSTSTGSDVLRYADTPHWDSLVSNNTTGNGACVLDLQKFPMHFVESER